MRYCGLVIDRKCGDFIPTQFPTFNPEPKYQQRRIYSDEIPMADDKTLSQFGPDKYIMRAAIKAIELGEMVVIDS